MQCITISMYYNPLHSQCNIISTQCNLDGFHRPDSRAQAKIQTEKLEEESPVSNESQLNRRSEDSKFKTIMIHGLLNDPDSFMRNLYETREKTFNIVKKLFDHLSLNIGSLVKSAYRLRGRLPYFDARPTCIKLTFFDSNGHDSFMKRIKSCLPGSVFEYSKLKIFPYYRKQVRGYIREAQHLSFILRRNGYRVRTIDEDDRLNVYYESDGQWKKGCAPTRRQNSWTGMERPSWPFHSTGTWNNLLLNRATVGKIKKVWNED